MRKPCRNKDQCSQKTESGGAHLVLRVPPEIHIQITKHDSAICFMAAMVLDAVSLPKPMLKFVCQCNGVQRGPLRLFLGE